ncbi:MAG: maleylacetoacetate isomerase [Gammaproteobacteria bacterium]
MTLYTYWRSSASYRVRIALNLKGVEYEPRFVHLMRDGGEQFAPEYRALNPQSRVPTLVHDAIVVTQSLAIIEYLDERFPKPPLLPADPAGRARVRSLAQLVTSDIQPLQNASVTRYLRSSLAMTDEQIAAWMREWIGRGFAALEQRLAREPETAAFCHGEHPTLADCCLVPQCYTARRFGVDPAEFPAIARIDATCSAVPAFGRAAPERQPDAE